MKRLRARVRGRVQGVGFRAFVVRRAQEQGLAGRVRNLSDGTVEVEAEGSAGGLEALLSDLRRGPSHARVEAVDECWSDGPARHRDFGIG